MTVFSRMDRAASLTNAKESINCAQHRCGERCTPTRLVSDGNRGAQFRPEAWRVSRCGAAACDCEGERALAYAPDTSKSRAWVPLVDHALRGTSRPLPEDARVQMQQALGHDFSKVRIHDDNASSLSAHAVGAGAYTVGNHIVFSRRTHEFAPGSLRGLLAHELAHTIQQPSGIPATVASLQMSDPRDASEVDAAVFARALEVEPVTRSAHATHRGLLVGLRGQRIARDCDGDKHCESPPESNPCPLERCRVIDQAFKNAKSMFIDARTDLDNYTSPGATPLTKKRVEAALRRHLKWEPPGSGILIPYDPVASLNRRLDKLEGHFRIRGADCPPTGRTTVLDGEDVGVTDAHVYPGWETDGGDSPGCYQFFPAFFAEERRTRAKIVIHEMMHTWAGATDFAYEGRHGYPPSAALAIDNADSIANVVRDLGK